MLVLLSKQAMSHALTQPPSVQTWQQRHRRVKVDISWRQALAISMLALLLFSALHGSLTMRKRKSDKLQHQAQVSDLGARTFWHDPNFGPY